MKIYLESLDGLRKAMNLKHKGASVVRTVIGGVGMKAPWYGTPVKFRNYMMSDRMHRGRRIYVEIEI